MMVKTVIVFLILMPILLYLDHKRLLLVLPQSKAQVRLEVEEIYHKIHLADSRASVEKFIDHDAKNKKFKVRKQSSVIYIIPPTELDGLTWFWTILIFFDDNNLVQGVAIRPTDGHEYWFCQAPADKGYIPEDYRSEGNCIR